MAANPAKRVAALIGGGLLLVIGVVLLVLPGPGLLLVLAGLVILANQFPSIDKYVNPVEKRAMQAMEQSVASPLRITGSVLAGLALIAAGDRLGPQQAAVAGRLAHRVEPDPLGRRRARAARVQLPQGAVQAHRVVVTGSQEQHRFGR